MRWLRDRGYDVVVGDCLDGATHVSAPKAERAAELMAMLTDSAIAAVVPPWGGETAIDLLDQLDWDRLADAEPTWLVGFSDMTTVMLPITLRLGWATLHGANLMDTPYTPVDGLAHWTALASMTGPLTQQASGVFGNNAYGNWAEDPTAEDYLLDDVGTWSTLGGRDLDVTGRLIGGCIEAISLLAATPYGDIAAYGREHADDGLVLYLEASEWPAGDICRALHSMRLAGWFEHARAVLIGRTSAPAIAGLTQHEAVVDALGDLGIPVVLDVECGHVPPYLPLVNGALAHVVADGDRREITQSLQ